MKGQRLNFRLVNPKPNTQLAKQDAESEGEGNIMQGFATLYDFTTELWFYTMSIDREAFKESLERGDEVVALFNHNMDLLLGRSPGTLKLDWNQEKGLYTKTDLPDHYLGEFARIAIARGDINQMSIGFEIVEDELTKEPDKKPHFHVTKANIYDISAVTFAQIPETDIEVVKGEFSGRKESELEVMLQRHMDAKDVEAVSKEAVEVMLQQHLINYGS